MDQKFGWGVLWRQKNKLDGVQDRLLFGKVFRTRSKARCWIEENYGYIRNRPDLRAEPHGWRVPLAVKVKVEVVK